MLAVLARVLGKHHSSRKLVGSESSPVPYIFQPKVVFTISYEGSVVDS